MSSIIILSTKNYEYQEMIFLFSKIIKLRKLFELTLSQLIYYLNTKMKTFKPLTTVYLITYFKIYLGPCMIRSTPLQTYQDACFSLWVGIYCVTLEIQWDALAVTIAFFKSSVSEDEYSEHQRRIHKNHQVKKLHIDSWNLKDKH